MTRKDMRLQYKNDTGDYPGENNHQSSIHEVHSVTREYVNWLEENLLKAWK